MNHELSIPIAFLAGIVSFLSPCVLPLVPGYISMLSGASIEELKKEARGELLAPRAAQLPGFCGGLFRGFCNPRGLGNVGGTIPAGASIHIQYYCRNHCGDLWVALDRLGEDPAALSRGAFGYGCATSRLGRGVPGGICVCLWLDSLHWTDSSGHPGHLRRNAKRCFKACFSWRFIPPDSPSHFCLQVLGSAAFLKFYGGFRKHLQAVEVASGVLLIALGTLMAFNKLTIISGYFSFLNRFQL